MKLLLIFILVVILSFMIVIAAAYLVYYKPKLGSPQMHQNLDEIYHRGKIRTPNNIRRYDANQEVGQTKKRFYSNHGHELSDEMKVFIRKHGK